MTCASVADIKQAFEESPANARSIAAAINGVTPHNFKEDAVTAWLEGHKRQHLAHVLGKYARPWEIVNLTARLDKDQPWIGVEYETGYANKEMYENVVNYIWQNFSFSTIDHEGCGKYPCEITFSPVNMNDFMADDYKMDKLLAWSEKNAPKSAHRGAVGTHVNISTPGSRKISLLNMTRVAQGINALLGALTNEENKEFFGRNPYGRAYSHHFGKNQWIEFKLFDSTGSSEVWKKYKNVTAKLVELVEYLSTHEEVIPSPYYDSTGKIPFDNLYAGFGLGQDAYHKPVSTNLGAFLRGEITPDKITLKYEKVRRAYFF